MYRKNDSEEVKYRNAIRTSRILGWAVILLFIAFIVAVLMETQ
jgi:t-SNARE complex subunit (syntaxin)